MTLKSAWQDALSVVTIRHIDPTCTPYLEVLGDESAPELLVAVKQARDTLNQDRRFAQLNVSTVRLLYWPGSQLAQAWLAAAWAGYIQHEALELVTVLGVRPLDPHKPPHDFDRGLRCGFPVELTPATVSRTLRLVMSDEAAVRLMTEAR